MPLPDRQCCRCTAGLQRSVFGSADGLTFYTSLGTPDDQRWDTLRRHMLWQQSCSTFMELHTLLHRNCCRTSRMCRSTALDSERRRTGSDGGGDGASEPKRDAPWQPAACGDRRYRHSTSAPSAASPARSSCSRRGSGDGGADAGSPGRPARPAVRWRRKALPAAPAAAQTDVSSQPAADQSGADQDTKQNTLYK